MQIYVKMANILTYAASRNFSQDFRVISRRVFNLFRSLLLLTQIFKTNIWLASNYRYGGFGQVSVNELCHEFRLVARIRDAFVQCMKSFVFGRDGSFITRNNFRNGEQTEYSRTFNPLLKNRSYPRHGMRVGSNGRNSSRSSQPVERETMRRPMENRRSRKTNARTNFRSYEIIGSRTREGARNRRETIAINQTSRYCCDGSVSPWRNT